MEVVIPTAQRVPGRRQGNIQGQTSCTDLLLSIWELMRRVACDWRNEMGALMWGSDDGCIDVGIRRLESVGCQVGQGCPLTEPKPRDPCITVREVGARHSHPVVGEERDAIAYVQHLL